MMEAADDESESWDCLPTQNMRVRTRRAERVCAVWYHVSQLVVVIQNSICLGTATASHVIPCQHLCRDP